VRGLSAQLAVVGSVSSFGLVVKVIDWFSYYSFSPFGKNSKPAFAKAELRNEINRKGKEMHSD
jgi:hypothetical protein